MVQTSSHHVTHHKDSGAVEATSQGQEICTVTATVWLHSTQSWSCFTWMSRAVKWEVCSLTSQTLSLPLSPLCSERSWTKWELKPLIGMGWWLFYNTSARQAGCCVFWDNCRSAGILQWTVNVFTLYTSRFIWQASHLEDTLLTQLQVCR